MTVIVWLPSPQAERACWSGEAPAWIVCESAALYRPRRPERSTFYLLLSESFEAYRRVHSERFEPRHGLLRRVVERAVQGFLDCGRHLGGFARLRCVSCRAEHLIAFSCQTRNFCPSCQAKRAALFGKILACVILQAVPHRHVVFTVPRSLRLLFERDRRLLSILARSTFDATRACLRKRTHSLVPRSRADCVALRAIGGKVPSPPNPLGPHIHALVTTGLVERGGGFHPVARFDTARMEECFRRLVLGRLLRAERLSESFHDALLSWQHSGFSVHAGAEVQASNAGSLERLGRYMTRAPISLAKACQGG